MTLFKLIIWNIETFIAEWLTVQIVFFLVLKNHNNTDVKNNRIRYKKKNFKIFKTSLNNKYSNVLYFYSVITL